MLKEDVDCLERLLKKIETKLAAFEIHITHMQAKLDEVKEQDQIYYVRKF